MPIQLNLLAESQAAEEMRRRDPVKRAIWISGLLVVLMLLWSITVQAKVMFAKRELSKVEAQMTKLKPDYQAVQEDLSRLRETTNKLGALYRLASNRLLHGTVLNAFQQCVVDDVQLTRLKIDQAYTLIEEVKAKTNGNRITPAKPATVTEKIVATLDAKDFSSNPGGDQVNLLKEKIASQAYFKEMLAGTNSEVRMVNLSQPTITSEGTHVQFSLQISYPERTR